VGEGSDRVVIAFPRARAPGCVEPAEEAFSGQVPSALPSGPAVTHGDDRVVYTRVRPRPATAGLRSAARAFSSGAHVTSAPKSLAVAHQRVHEAAGRLDTPLLAWLRLVYGYCHLTLKALFNGLEAATESPAGLLALMVTGFLFWFCLVR
jgi:hypothetical protein